MFAFVENVESVTNSVLLEGEVRVAGGAVLTRIS